MTAEKISFAGIKGFNYVPSTAVNTIAFWQDFDADLIDRELALGASFGFNSARIFLQYIVYEAYPDRLLANFARFLDLAGRHNLTVMPVLFDDCFTPDGAVGPQPAPRPGVHNSCWVSSPGRSRKVPANYPRLAQYVKDLVSRHRDDERIVAWDLYNEPRLLPDTYPLLKRAFAWARSEGPTQPLTTCWQGEPLSDLITIHPYLNPEAQPDLVKLTFECAQSYGLPVVATEMLGRPDHGELHQILPVLKQYGVGWYLWELMIGVDQTRLQWDVNSPVSKEIAFQGFAYPDGTPYSEKEVELIAAW